MPEYLRIKGVKIFYPQVIHIVYNFIPAHYFSPRKVRFSVTKAAGIVKEVAMEQKHLLMIVQYGKLRALKF
jgi:hypothetical protein